MRLIFALMMLVSTSAYSATINFAWDAPDSPPAGTKYKLYVCTDSAMSQCTATDAGTSLTVGVPLDAGTYWVYCTAYAPLIETEPQAGMQESDKSNVINFVLQVPPGNPKNFRIRIN